MIAKLFVIAVFLLILANLGAAMFFMLKDKGQTDRTVKALTWRIGLSLLLFILLLVGYFTDVIQPHGIY